METTDQGKYLQEDDYISMSEQNAVHLASTDTYIKYSIRTSVSPSIRHQVCLRDNWTPVQARITKFAPQV